YALMPNPSFEQIDEAGTALGWQSSNGVPTIAAGVDGERAARLASTGEGLSIATTPFPVPPTGQVAVTAHVKVIEVANDAELRLVVEEVGGITQPKFVPLSAERLMHD